MELNDSQAYLLTQLNNIPPDINAISKLLADGNYSKEDISLVGAVFIDGCFGDYIETDSGKNILFEPHSPYVYDIVKILVENGLDANAIFDDLNIMDRLSNIGTQYVAADTMKLLLESGGNPSLIIDGERLFDKVDFDVIFGAIEQSHRNRYDALVHCWLVLIGFGAKMQDGSMPLDLMDVYDENNGQYVKFNVDLFKEHQNFFVGLSLVPGRNEKWSLHIFDKNTLWEIARL